jgi:hypothetical protein
VSVTIFSIFSHLGFGLAGYDDIQAIPMKYIVVFMIGLILFLFIKRPFIISFILSLSVYGGYYGNMRDLNQIPSEASNTALIKTIPSVAIYYLLFLSLFHLRKLLLNSTKTILPPSN